MHQTHFCKKGEILNTDYLERAEFYIREHQDNIVIAKLKTNKPLTENDIDSLFKSGGTSALLSAVSGLDDFELICFLIIRNEKLGVRN